MTKHIIALTGPIDVGKSTVAQELKVLLAGAAGVGEQAVTRARKQGQFALEAIARRGGLPSYYGRPQCRPGAVTEHTHPRTQR